MTNALFYQECTKAHYCLACGEIWTRGVFDPITKAVHNICYDCGYNMETFGWPGRLIFDKEKGGHNEGKEN